jgi:hypothetical protein
MTPSEAAARAESARIYGGLTPEHNSKSRRLPDHATHAERVALDWALSTASPHTYPQGDEQTQPDPGDGEDVKSTLPKKLRDQIECALSRTGSIAAAMAATGCTYRTVRDVWRGMAA